MDSGPTAVRVSPTARQAEEWAVVLAASGIRHQLVPVEDGWALVVDEDDRRRARAVLSAYERENRPEPRVPAQPIGRGAVGLGIALAVSLLGFFVVTGPRAIGVAWFERGSASAARILHGELWRTVTALTLHADLAHVLGNALACLVLIPPVCQALGPGTGLWMLLIAGAAGNALTALVHGAPYSSVGASTLTFGAIGILSAQALASRWRGQALRRRPWVVVAASLLLLMMLGTAEGADVLGHFFGLLAGFALGLGAILAGARPGPARAEWTLVGAAVVAVAACWWIASS